MVVKISEDSSVFDEGELYRSLFLMSVHDYSKTVKKKSQ